MSAERMTDAEGHEWPLTGYWCMVCGMPLHHVLRTIGMHVNCEMEKS